MRWLLVLLVLLAPAFGDESLVVVGRGGAAIVNPATLATELAIPTRGGAPAFLYSNLDRSRLYLITGARELVEILDVKSGKLTRTLTLSQPKELPYLRAFIYGLCTDPQEKFLYLYILPSVRERESIRAEDCYVAVVDLESGKKVATIPAPAGISMLAFKNDGSEMYLLGRDVYVMDARTRKITLKESIRHPEYQGEGETDIIAEWVHYRECDSVASLPIFTEDPSTKRWFIGLLTLDLKTGELDRYEAGPPPESLVPFSAVITPDRQKGYIIFNHLVEMSLAERKVTRMVRLPKSYSILTVSGDSSRLFFCGSGRSVARYDIATGEVVQQVEMPWDTTDMMVVPR
ncbi:MAG: YncE family protein [Vulcanimicrobiota bacterium]